MRPATVHRCKCHGELYTVCPLCACQYCPRYWPACPRTDWAPGHATNDTERGRRARVLDEARKPLALTTEEETDGVQRRD